MADVRVVGPDGVHGTMDEGEFATYAAQGYQRVTDEQWEALEEQRRRAKHAAFTEEQGGPSAVIGGLLAAGVAAPVGFAELFVPGSAALLPESAQQAVRVALGQQTGADAATVPDLPGAVSVGGLIGRTLGQAAALAATGGASGLGAATARYTAAGATRTAATALQAGTRAVAARVVGEGVASRAAGVVARGVLEGLAAQTSMNITNAVLGDPDAIGEALIANLLPAVLLGGAVEGIAGVGRVGIRALRGRTTATARSAATAARETAEAASAGATTQGVEGVLEVTAPELTPEVRNVTAAAIADDVPFTEDNIIQWMRGNTPEAVRLQGLFRNQRRVLDDATRELTETVTDASGAGRAVMREGVQLKPETITRLVTDDGRDAVLAATRSELDGLESAMNEIIAEPQAYGGFAPQARRIQARSREAWGRIEDAIERGENASARAFIEMDNVKRFIGKQARGGQTVAEGNAIQLFRDRYENVRGFLENESLWGEGARLQRRINPDWVEALWDADVADMFATMRRGTRQFEPVYVGDAAKMQSLVGNLTNAIGDQRVEILLGNVRAKARLLRSLGEVYEIPAAARAEIERYAAAAQRMEATIQRATRDVANVNLIQQMLADEARQAALAQGGILQSIARGAAAVVHAPSTAPMTQMQQRGIIMSFAGRTLRAIGSGVANFLGRGATGAGAAVNALGPLRLPAALNTYDAVRDLIAQQSADPAGMTERIAERIRDIESAEQEVAASMAATMTRAISFLASKLPPEVGSNPMQPQLNARPPSQEARDELMRYAAVALQPLVAVDAIARGDIRQQDIEALRVVYPRLFDAMGQIVMGHIVEASEKGDEVPYDRRIKLGRMLGVPADWSQEPDALQLLQARYARATQQRAVPRRATGRARRAARSAMTDVQRIEAGIV